MSTELHRMRLINSTLEMDMEAAAAASAEKDTT